MIKKFAALNFALICLATTKDLIFENDDCLLKFTNFLKPEKSDPAMSLIQSKLPVEYRSACIHSPEASKVQAPYPKSKEVTATMAGGRLTVVCPESHALFSFNYSKENIPFEINWFRQKKLGWTTDPPVILKKDEDVVDIYHYNLLVLCDKVAARRELLTKLGNGSVDWNNWSADQYLHRSSTAILQGDQSGPNPLGLLAAFKAPINRGYSIELKSDSCRMQFFGLPNTSGIAEENLANSIATDKIFGECPDDPLAKADTFGGFLVDAWQNGLIAEPKVVIEQERIGCKNEEDQVFAVITGTSVSPESDHNALCGGLENMWKRIKTLASERNEVEKQDLAGSFMEISSGYLGADNVLTVPYYVIKEGTSLARTVTNSAHQADAAKIDLKTAAASSDDQVATTTEAGADSISPRRSQDVPSNIAVTKVAHPIGSIDSHAVGVNVPRSIASIEASPEVHTSAGTRAADTKAVPQFNAVTPDDSEKIISTKSILKGRGSLIQSQDSRSVHWDEGVSGDVPATVRKSLSDADESKDDLEPAVASASQDGPGVRGPANEASLHTVNSRSDSDGFLQPETLPWVGISAGTSAESHNMKSTYIQSKYLYVSASGLVTLGTECKTIEGTTEAPCLQIRRLIAQYRELWQGESILELSGPVITELLAAIGGNLTGYQPDRYQLTLTENLNFEKTWKSFYKFYKTMFQVSPLVNDPSDSTNVVGDTCSLPEFANDQTIRNSRLASSKKCETVLSSQKYAVAYRFERMKEFSATVPDDNLLKSRLLIQTKRIVAAAKTFVAIVGKKDALATHKLVKVAKTASRRAKDFLKKGAVSWSFDIVPTSVDPVAWKNKMMNHLDIPQSVKVAHGAETFVVYQFSAGSMTFLECTQGGVTLYRFRKHVPGSVDRANVECKDMFTTHAASLPPAK